MDAVTVPAYICWLQLCHLSWIFNTQLLLESFASADRDLEPRRRTVTLADRPESGSDAPLFETADPGTAFVSRTPMVCHTVTMNHFVRVLLTHLGRTD